jgi:lysophospholipase L1-like esterase
VLYGDVAAKALGRNVEVTNLATNDSLESGQLLARIQTDQRHKDAIASADLLTLQIGWNDWQGPCSWPNDEPCWTRGSAGVEKNLAAILDEVATLRDGKPTAVRVVTYYNPWVGPLEGPDAEITGDPAFQTYWVEHLKGFDNMICRVAESRGAVCVDLLTAFNGPTGDTNAGESIGPDGSLSAAGHELIAKTIGAAGYAPLG